MTYKEYLTKTLYRFGITEGDVDVMLFEQNLDPTAEADVKTAKTAIHAELTLILPTVIGNISEGGYSISWNIEGVRLWYKALSQELGLLDVLENINRATIKDKSNIW